MQYELQDAIAEEMQVDILRGESSVGGADEPHFSCQNCQRTPARHPQHPPQPSHPISSFHELLQPPSAQLQLKFPPPERLSAELARHTPIKTLLLTRPPPLFHFSSSQLTTLQAFGSSTSFAWLPFGILPSGKPLPQGMSTPANPSS